MKRKIWNLAVVFFCLVLSLSGCRIHQTVPTTQPINITTVPPTTLPQETTLPVPDPAQLYLDGIQALGTDAVSMDISCEQTMTVAGQTFTANLQQTVSYWNLQTEDFISLVSNTYDLGNHEFTVTETFFEGFVYQELNYEYFMSAMQAQDAADRYPGVRLLDPELYDISVDGENTILFRNASGVEDWVVDQEGEVIFAEALVSLSAEGVVTDCAYTVEYNYGPAHYSEVYKVTYTKPSRQPIAPEKPEKYTELTNLDSMWLLELSYGFIQQAKQYSMEKTSSIQAQIAGVMLNRGYSLNVMPSMEGSNDYRLTTSIYLMDQSGSAEYINDEKFIAGQYSSVEDDGRPTYNTAVSEAVMNSFCQNLMVEDILQADNFEDAVLTDLGSLLLVEYKGTEALGEDICDSICAELFGKANYLDDYVSGYKTNEVRYHLSIDKYTMLPVSLGYYFEGCHTYQGQELLMIEYLVQKYDLATLTAFEAIHERPSADQKPEVMPTPLFYHVTGTDGQEMWLFGTIHVGDDRTGYLPQEIYDALEGSAALVVECDTEAFEEQLEEDEKLQEKVSDCYYYSDGTIQDHLDTEDLYMQAAKVMIATGNYNYSTDYLKAGIWSNTIDNYYLSQGHKLTSEKGVEERLMIYADEHDIPVWEAESSLFQLEMMSGYSNELQEFQLYTAVYSHGRSNWEGAEELYEMWLAGDEEALIKQMERTSWGWTEEDFEDMESYSEEEKAAAQYILDNLDTINEQIQKLWDEYIKAMETDRNAGMLETAKGYLESGDTVFFAVGLAHLLAEDGLVFTLREAGYTVELVTYANPA